MLTIHVWPRRLKEFLLTHPLYKSPRHTPYKFDRRIVVAHGINLFTMFPGLGQRLFFLSHLRLRSFGVGLR